MKFQTYPYRLITNDAIPQSPGDTLLVAMYVWYSPIMISMLLQERTGSSLLFLDH